MALTSRVKYHYRSARRFWNNWRLPAFLERSAARAGLAAILILLGGAYIVKTNELSTTGYQIHDLERKVAALKDDTAKLEVQIASLQSMPAINRRLTELKMVAPVSVSYLKNGGAVAAR